MHANTVFMSPETLQLRQWRSVLSCVTFREKLVLVAVDEAHCISEWCVRLLISERSALTCLSHRGQDFRKSFRMIGGIRALTSVPFMALSASAPPNVEAEIVDSLDLKSPAIISCDLNRPNIYSASRKYSLNVSATEYCVIF
jgi:superfamily II DNA helicase RecQ